MKQPGDVYEVIADCPQVPIGANVVWLGEGGGNNQSMGLFRWKRKKYRISYRKVRPVPFTHHHNCISYGHIERIEPTITDPSSIPVGYTLSYKNRPSWPKETVIATTDTQVIAAGSDNDGYTCCFAYTADQLHEAGAVLHAPNPPKKYTWQQLQDKLGHPFELVEDAS